MTREHSRHAGRGSGTGASAGATEGPLAAAPPSPGPPSPGPPALAERLVAALRDARHRTLFATELAALARAAGCAGDRFERLLADQERAGRLLVLSRPPPDVHLAGADLRTVHLCADDPVDPTGPTDPTGSARQRGEAHWAEFLRTFLATRRCC